MKRVFLLVVEERLESIVMAFVFSLLAISLTSSVAVYLTYRYSFLTHGMSASLNRQNLEVLSLVKDLQSLSDERVNQVLKKYGQ